MCSSPHSSTAPLAIFLLLFLPRVLLAQLVPCKEQFPFASHKPPQIKINVIDVEFTPQSSLPDELRAEIVERIRNFKITASIRDPDADWPNAVAAGTISKALRAGGYFQGSSKLTPYLVKAETDQRSYILSIEMETGPVYHIGELRVRDATVFSPSELRDQIPLKTGDVMNDDKLWEGIESIKQLYAQKGYIETNVGVTGGIDHTERRVDVTLELQEGKQYRVGSIEVSGLDSKTANLLRSSLEPGQVFHRTIIKKFLTENRETLPADASERDVMVERNSEEGTVAIVFDFRRCSGMQTAGKRL
jgi:outer membrane translocation and assembly module TamA